MILPLFLPPDIRIDRLLRAMAGMTFFSAAYLAENVRGGLAAVPEGQEEAAKALGLNGFQTTLLHRAAAGAAGGHPADGRPVHQPVQRYDPGLHHGVLDLLSVGRSILQANPEFIGAASRSRTLSLRWFSGCSAT